jgi:hypothetical protein
VIWEAPDGALNELVHLLEPSLRVEGEEAFLELLELTHPGFRREMDATSSATSCPPT